MNPAAFGVGPRQARVAARLDRVAARPPQALVIEGGDAGERAAMALFYAARLNCRSGAPPCGFCPVCRQIVEDVFLDLVYHDGLLGSIQVDEMREVRRVVGEPPRGDGCRVVVLAEAQELTIAAANALLKSMEEPRPGNVFALLTPQRERLLPTLSSRSWVLTLAWPERDRPFARFGPDGAELEDPSEWAGALLDFWATGRGFMERSGVKGRISRLLAQQVLLLCARGLVEALSGRAGPGMGAFLSERLDIEHLRRFDVLLAESQEALIMQVNPALVLTWLATRVYCWLRG